MQGQPTTCMPDGGAWLEMVIIMLELQKQRCSSSVKVISLEGVSQSEKWQ